jgi:NAD(P)-dependent dehydrogenase (short-subunit alcohol dehydrogenase family)
MEGFSMYDFSSKIVMITGASGNLGTATYKAFMKYGGNVALLSLDADNIPPLDPELGFAEESILKISIDLTSENEVNAAVKKTLTTFGQIDILVNIAGGYKGGIPLHETPSEQLDSLFDLNFRTTFNTCKAVIPSMLASGSGSIINIAARAGQSGLAKLAIYSASKAAVIRLTESLAAETKHEGIRVNCILPGTIDTPRNRSDMPKADFSRWVSPDSIADVILFLASEGARSITGASIPVYGRS